MAPNFYVHATLLQPHAQTVNDLPIRMYGVEGAKVIDRRTILHPQIEVADEILPQREFAIRIHERDQNRGGKGIKGMQTIEDDYIEELLMTTT